MIRRLLARLRSVPAAPARRKSAPRFIPAVEFLETRLAPATLVSPSKLTYQDVDGDNVTVTLSKPLLTAGMFTFDTGGVTGVNTAKQQLQTIDLSGLTAATANGAALTITATRSATTGGDGRANVGFIDTKGVNLAGLDLGAVIVDGDLGRIIAGDPNNGLAGVVSLTVQSLGRFGLSTQGGVGDLHSLITGRLGKLTVKGDVLGAFVDVTGGADEAKIGSINVTGSVIGIGTDPSSGHIRANGNIGAVKIGRDIVGAGGLGSGQIQSLSGAITGGLLGGVFIGVSVGGSVIGGAGGESGLIRSDTDMAKVKVGGSVVGGSDNGSGAIRSDSGKIASVTLGGSLIGGSAGLRVGVVHAAAGLGPVKITGDILGGAGDRSGGVFVDGAGNIASVTVGGSVRSGTGTLSGFITAGLAPGGALGPIIIGGSLIGTSANPVVIAAAGQLAPTTTDVAIKSLTVGGRVEFANILAGYDSDLVAVNADAQIGAVLVKGDWIASNLVAGVEDVNNDGFGNVDDALIVEAGGEEPLITAKISSVTINGYVMGTLTGIDHFGFVAQQIVKFVIGGTTIPLSAGLDNLVIGATNLPAGDVNILEV